MDILENLKLIRYVLILHLSGLLLSCAYENLSYRKPANQSTTSLGLEAGNAVDGNLTTCMRAEPIGGHSPYQSASWMVDLGGEYNIHSINILFKNYEGFEHRQRGRFAGFWLFVSRTRYINGSSLCYMDGSKLPPLNFTTTCTASGRYVIYYNERLNGVQYPEGYEVSNNVFTELCEVNVIGCTEFGVYGFSCDLPCPVNCKDSVCDIENGTCFSCEFGWAGTHCDTKESKHIPSSISPEFVAVIVVVIIAVGIVAGIVFKFGRGRMPCCSIHRKTYEVNKI